MTDAPKQEVQLTGRSGQPWSLQTYVRDQVMPNVVALLPNGEADWPMFEIALRAAVLAKPRSDGRPGLADAIAKNPESALVGMVKCARLGLSLNPVDEHFDLIPRAGVVHGEVRAKGWEHLALASGAIEFIQHDVVYRQELDRSKPFLDPVTQMPTHVADSFGRDDWKDADVIGAYCAIKLKGHDRLVTHVMSRGEINKRRAMAQTDKVWGAWFREMCIAKVDKRAFKDPRIPKTAAMAEALRMEEDDDKPAPIAPLSSAPTPIRGSAPKKTGGQLMWDARNEEPLPTDEKHREDLLKAIDTECVAQSITDETLQGLAISLLALDPNACAEDATIENLSSEDLNKLLDKLIDLREKGGGG